MDAWHQDSTLREASQPGLGNMDKLIYHSQPEVTGVSHNMLEGAATASFHKAFGLFVVPFCSILSALPSIAQV